AEGLGGAEVFVEPGGQLAGAAAEVDDALRAPALRRRVEQRQEVVERAGTLGAELPVLGGVPGVGCAHPPLVPGQAASVAAVASASPSPSSVRRRWGPCSAGDSPSATAAAAGPGGSWMAR